MSADDATPEAGDAEAQSAQQLSIAAHPRAYAAVRRARGWAGLIGFGLTAWLGMNAGLPFVDLVIRSIAIGALALLVVWAGAIQVWKQIVFAEVAGARKRAVEEQRAILEGLAAREDERTDAAA